MATDGTQPGPDLLADGARLRSLPTPPPSSGIAVPGRGSVPSAPSWTDSDLLFLSGQDVSALFDPAVAIETQRLAFTALGEGTAALPDKVVLPNPLDGSVAFCYTSRLAPHGGVVVKLGSVNPGNPDRGLPSISAMIVVLDAATGQPAAIMDGTVITTRRTAAASAVAVDVLARKDATELAVIGGGVQGREHVRMISRVRPIQAVRLWSPSEASRVAAAGELSAETGLTVRACASAREAVTGAEIVALCTLSFDPVIEASWLAPGATVLSIGSIEPSRREVGADVVAAAATVVVDDVPTAAAHAGPIVESLRTGVLGRESLHGLGDVLTGRADGRTGPDELVYYNSTGLGVQDAAAATSVLERARAGRIGQGLTR